MLGSRLSVIYRSWSVRRIYKYVVSLRQLWVCYKKRQLAVRYYSSVWPHPIHNCVPVRILHARDLSNSSITLTSKGHSRLFSRFRLVSNKIRPACVAPHVIETEKKQSYRLLTTRYRLKKWNTYFNEKSKVTILTYIRMISYEYEYFGSARTPVTKSSTRDHTHPCFASYKIEVSHAACKYEFRWNPRSHSWRYFIL